MKKWWGGLQTDTPLKRLLVGLPQRKIHVPCHADRVQLPVLLFGLVSMVHLVE